MRLVPSLNFGRCLAMTVKRCPLRSVWVTLENEDPSSDSDFPGKDNEGKGEEEDEDETDLKSASVSASSESVLKKAFAKRKDHPQKKLVDSSADTSPFHNLLNDCSDSALEAISSLVPAWGADFPSIF
ncbi:hypothetical protein K402DRAFT_421143 [Aulographum hederae CBS 113979]|uniref:Uncharacterized protein n=1 Tax=Aulographum hederae CBS 113979 TaxID=1176131 RepID=A0A6G1H0E4_9PEZI|nr:hypothetical protein K402DRAFT_421143 [Aulographum hederae CBS 113979]